MSEFDTPELAESNARLLEEAAGDLNLFYRLRALESAEDLLKQEPDNESFIRTRDDMLEEVENYKRGSQ